MLFSKDKREFNVDEVFGMSPKILEPSYVDRGELDAEIQKHSGRNSHIALRGESKCGKSWIRQKNIPNAIVVQSRFGRSVEDLYTDALSQLGIEIEINRQHTAGTDLKVAASQSAGIDILGRIALKQGIKTSKQDSVTTLPLGRGVDDLCYISEIFKESGRRLVIEDFHYLRDDERRRFSSELKTLWDYNCFIVIIGIWQENNLLLHLNSDLSGRVEEISIYWSQRDLQQVLINGSAALNIEFSDHIARSLIEDSFGNVGILQKLTRGVLDEIKCDRTKHERETIDDMKAFETTALKYAEQLNGIYQTFAQKVSRGIRKRANSTGIYAHMISVILEARPDDLIQGLSVDEIFDKCVKREPRILKGNLKSAMSKIDYLQTDEEGRGLVITYDEIKEEVFVVNRQLFFYQKWGTVKWPWENIISDVDDQDSAFKADEV